MNTTLSPSALRVLVRGLFLVLAFGSLYGAWDNREFFLRAPFYVVVFIDLSLGIHFLIFSAFFEKVRNAHRAYMLHVVTFMWAYSIIAGAVSSWAHTNALGLSEAVRIAGFTSARDYYFSEALYVLILPNLAFAVIWWLVRKSVGK